MSPVELRSTAANLAADMVQAAMNILLEKPEYAEDARVVVLAALLYDATIAYEFGWNIEQHHVIFSDQFNKLVRTHSPEELVNTKGTRSNVN